VLTERLVLNQGLTRRASADGHYVDDTVRSRLTEEGRVVGILVHAWLERIACDGLNMWPTVALEARLEDFKTQLSKQGIPLSRLDDCALIVLNCLLNTVGSSRGRWLLSSQQDASCELALNGIIDGQLIRATIDRTFLDEDSVRWIVDYKTSSPGEREDPDRFVRKELERYQGQLKIYQGLIAQLYPEVQIRTALYFPLFDGWAELEL
jgi:ATP-dependent exoDNAse (exonuclease V) beta subunit